jgi:two-component system phosphate regulon response regulator OmpR
MYHILIIDDDDRIRNLLEKYLIKNNFIVSTASNTTEARNIMQKYIFDLMIVDNMMPNESGIDFLNNIRQNNNNTPAIMLTALGEIENRIEGLSAGADDYLSKPFEPKELVLRINNILKRISRITNKNNIINFDDFSFNLDKNELYNSNILIKLTDTEIKILNIFFNNLNVVLTREDLCKMLNGIDERSIDVQITRLRKKIELDPKNPKFLKTIRHKGYLFCL